MQRLKWSLLTIIITIYTVVFILAIDNRIKESDVLVGFNKQLRQQIAQQRTIIEEQSNKIKELSDEINALKQDNDKLRTFRAKVTAYAPLDNKSGICADDTPHTTATGKLPSRGIIAVDPRKIPYGTTINIPGYDIGEAQDTGGALRNYNGIQLDVVMESHREAIDWGVQYIDVKLQ